MQRSARRFRVFQTSAVFLALVTLLPEARSQTVISAMAGYIHHAEGEVFLDDRPIQPKPADFLLVLDGQRLRTGEGKAEVMLTPGGFLRLGSNSEMEMISAGLARARLRVTSGAAIIQMLSIFEKDAVAVLAGDGEIQFPKPGVYRVNATNSPPALKVFEGKAVVLSGDHKRDLKGKQALALSGIETAEAEKFDPKEKDPLDEWNQTRAEALGKIAKSSKGADGGMDPLYREWIEMTLRRPQPTHSPRMPEPRSPQPRSQPSSGATPRGR
jgi:hypothetical protein